MTPPPRRTGVALAVGTALVAGLGGCWNEAKDEWACIGPIVEVVKWRDEREAARLYGGKPITAAALAQEERDRVLAAVEALAPRRRACELTWSVLMHQPPDNPGLRLREEVLLRVLELPPRDYPPVAVGWSGVTVAGRPPVAMSR
ncbi:MAG: hypothetical protein Q8P41_12625 [Pseudomonadota bacterium]|nr:hypothetical protein [Pseudomonadota bacterium]